MFDDFWRQEEILDRIFEKQFFKDSEDDEEELHCDKKCINCMGGICIAHNWSCRTKLDMKEMKFS